MGTIPILLFMIEFLHFSSKKNFIIKSIKKYVKKTCRHHICNERLTELVLFVCTKTDGYNKFTYVHWLLLFKRIGFVAFFAVEKKSHLHNEDLFLAFIILKNSCFSLDKKKLIEDFFFIFKFAETSFYLEK